LCIDTSESATNNMEQRGYIKGEQHMLS
jgi:hypothetical protein